VWATVLRVKPRYAGWVVAGIVLVAVAVIALRLANWYLTRFVITNKRLMSTEGVLARRVAMMPLLRVTDMRYAQSILGRLLGYGTFTLESASRRNAMRRVVDLPNPNELYLRMVEEMYEPAAVEARLARWSEEDEDESWLEELPADAVFELAERAGTAPLPVPVPVPTQRAAPARDPADEHSEIVGRIGTLAGQLAALAASVAGIVPAPAPAPQPAPEVPPQSATQPALEPPPEPAPGPAQPGPAQPRQAPAPEST
jgi:membrane protein YdbS with pleckstrin-like domain